MYELSDAKTLNRVKNMFSEVKKNILIKNKIIRNIIREIVEKIQ
jgi:hypothetical protein